MIVKTIYFNLFHSLIQFSERDFSIKMYKNNISPTDTLTNFIFPATDDASKVNLHCMALNISLTLHDPKTLLQCFDKSGYFALKSMFFINPLL